MSDLKKTSLTISVVLFHSRLDLLSNTLKSILIAVGIAREKLVLGKVFLKLIDNSMDFDYTKRAKKEIGKIDFSNVLSVDYECNKKNNGFGAAHNQTILCSRSDFHLILNPDVELDQFSLFRGISTLVADSNLLLLCPSAVSEEGEKLFLCKRYPSVFVLWLRGFASERARKIFHKNLDRYEMRDCQDSNNVQSVLLASGCFMLCKTKMLKTVGGFNGKYFLYFEDFDLSLRLGQLGSLAVDSRVSILHHGGNTGRKGLRHILFFVCSAFRFFNCYGWRFI